jgi:hypothetical protein
MTVLSNLKIIVDETPQGNPTGEIYAKVLESAADIGGPINPL